MKRRAFIAALGSAAAWPLVARAQQRERMRRIGVLMTLARERPGRQARIAAFLQGLQQLGWTDGRNVRIDYRWAAGNAERIRKIRSGIGRACARRHPGLCARVVLGAVATGDPYRADRVRECRRSGRRRLCRELGAAGRQRNWLYRVRIWHERKMAGAAQRDRAARDPSGGPSGSEHAAGIGLLGAIQSAAPSFGVELSPVGVRDAGEIERAITAFARVPNGGLIVTASALAAVHRDLIITLAARYRLPAVYPFALLRSGGGLISYGPDRRPVSGARPATLIASSRAKSLPTCRCRHPTKYETGDQPQDR